MSDNPFWCSTCKTIYPEKCTCQPSAAPTGSRLMTDIMTTLERVEIFTACKSGTTVHGISGAELEATVSDLRARYRNGER